jgi:hypothetical protein
MQAMGENHTFADYAFARQWHMIQIGRIVPK